MASRPRPFDIPSDLYPFESHWLVREGAALHYLDVGEGVPVLLLHGNPTWSFLYRDVLGPLRGQCRAVVPDYPGFGFSDHPEGYGYTPREHAGWVGALVDHLGLDRFLLVGQDWGGPIGLAVAEERAERVAGMVLANTWCWPPFFKARLFSLLVGGPLGRSLHRRRNAFVRWILPAGIARRERKTPAVLGAYRAPFPTPESRRGTWVFPREIRGSAGWLAGLEDRLDLLADRPVELVWAMADPMFGHESYLDRWRRHFPAARVDRVERASHYIQEDAPERVAGAVRRALERL